MKKKQETALLFRTHYHTKEIINEFEKIKNQLQESDVNVFYAHDDTIFKAPKKLNADLYLLTKELTNELKLPFVGFWRDAHYAIIRFSKDFPNYKYFWYVEFDVRYTGNWKDFIDYFSKTELDYLASGIERYGENLNYALWNKVNTEIVLEKRVKSFMPICRFSKSALVLLEQKHKEGHTGHCEVIIPTLLVNNGYTVGDFKGNRIPGPRGEEPNFVSWKDFKYRAIEFDEKKPNAMFHPVKSFKFRLYLYQNFKSLENKYRRLYSKISKIFRRV